MRPTLLFAAFGLAAAFAPAEAATFCVANPAQFQQALTTAAANGQSDEIRIRAGVHSATAATPGGFTYALAITDQQSVDMSGGWTDVACTQRDESATATTLLPAPGARLFDIGAFGGQPTVSIGNLQASFVASPLVGCVVVAGGAMNLRLQRVKISDNDCGSVVAGQVNGGTFTIRNSVFANNRSVDAIVRLYGVGDLAASQSTFANNTFVGNEVTESGFLVNVRAEPGDVKTIENNVVWNNTMQPINGVMRQFDTVEAAGSQLRHNRLQAMVGAFANGVGNTAGDPGFVSAADYRPRAGSPLVDAGVADPAGGTTPRDVSGQPRVQGARIDIGAFEAEAPLFAAGFEPPGA